MTSRRVAPLLVLCVVSCHPKEEMEGSAGGAPALPPADTMTFFELKEGAKSSEQTGAALTLESDVQAQTLMPGDRSNVKVAIAAIGLVTAGVNLALLWPRTFLLGVVSERPTHTADGWLWQRRFGLLGWDASLRAKLVDPALTTQMRVTGLKPENARYQNFLWYTGDHTAKEGVWTVYALEETGPVLQIIWQREAADHKQLTFTNVTMAKPGSGDRINYAIDGKVASMAVHDAMDAKGQPSDFSVTWNVDTGSGKMTANGMSVCWDTLASNQANIACPAGAWPMP